MRFAATAVLAVLMATILVAMARRQALANVPAGDWPGTAESLYPYIVPKQYLGHGDEASRYLARPLGHDLYVVLVFDLKGLVRNAMDKDLKRLGYTADEAHAHALQNLEALADANEVQMAVFPGPSGKPFILVGGSWAAATSLLLPRLREIAARALGTKEICASIPHREAMLIFAKGDRAYRDAMRALVREKESDGRKPLTFELFELTEAGVKAFSEP